LCNDYSIYGNFIGKGIIENNGTKIDKYDLMKLFVESPNNKRYCEKNYQGELFTSRHSRFIDNAASILNVDNKFHNPVKANALNCVLIKFIFALRPYGNFNTSHMIDFFENPFDSCEKKLAKTGYVKDIMSPVWDLLEKCSKGVNDSIFYNGKKNKFYNKDVFDFIQEAEGDTVYYDPPYYGAEPYEFYYDVLNSILMQDDLVKEKSNFNKDDWQIHFDQLLDISQKIPRWIISFGCEKITPTEFADIVKKHRPNARLIEIPYVYSVGARPKEDKPEKQGRTIEILVVADK
jgi:adenine-specific DNA methylase